MRGKTDLFLVQMAERADATNPELFLIHANQFLLAAQRLSGGGASRADPIGDSGWPVVYAAISHLFCHSIELYLKAFLSKKCLSNDVLKSRELGHDLIKLEKRCRELGLEVPFTTSTMINHLSPYHSSDSDFRLRYAQSTGYELPLPFRMNQAVVCLAEVVRTEVMK